MSELIGLSGYAQAGKDSVGNILVRKYGFKRVAFADRMKEIGLEINPMVDMVLGDHPRVVRLREIVLAVGWERAKQNPEIRQFLQRIGTEVGRNLLGRDVWVDLLFADWTPDQKWVITDVRFANEADRILMNNGFVVRVHRPGVEAANTHESETDLDGTHFDFELRNDGDLDELEERTADMVLDLFGSTTAVA